MVLVVVPAAQGSSYGSPMVASDPPKGPDSMVSPSKLSAATLALASQQHKGEEAGVESRLADLKLGHVDGPPNGLSQIEGVVVEKVWDSVFPDLFTNPFYPFFCWWGRGESGCFPDVLVAAAYPPLAAKRFHCFLLRFLCGLFMLQGTDFDRLASPVHDPEDPEARHGLLEAPEEDGPSAPVINFPPPP